MQSYRRACIQEENLGFAKKSEPKQKFTLRPDFAQNQAMIALFPFYQKFQGNFLTRLWRKFRRPNPYDGFYLYGLPGSGKTVIMDIFFASAPTTKKLKIHFHEFMLQIHHALEALRKQNKAQPLKIIATDLAKNCALICFDEFHVTDVGDAMLLKNLFTELFRRRIMLIATSNVAPKDLYQGGIARDQFLPFIVLLQKQCQTFAITALCDYRVGDMHTPLWYRCLGNGQADFLDFYAMFTQSSGDKITTPKIKLSGVSLNVAEMVGRVLRVNFADLCDQAISVADYLALCEKFDSFFVQNIPCLQQEDRNALKRFILLIDLLYSKQKILVCLATTSPYDIYQGTTHRDEFERTISRLLEMGEPKWINQKLP